MKIQDIPQTGKLGLNVTWEGRNGLIRRIPVTPKNPRSDGQSEVSDLLAQQTRRFDTLTDVQQDAWSVAERTPSLLGNPPPWTRVLPPFQTNSAQAWITVAPPQGISFYRLYRP